MAHTYIIAEAGVNHNGNLDLALQMVEVAKKAGADAIKFQTFKAESVVAPFAKKAEYQIRQTGNEENQLSMLKQLELKKEDYYLLFDFCEKQAIEFMSTPFDMESLHFLTQTLNVNQLKIASGEITNSPFLYACSLTHKPIIVSTGMSTLGDIEEALGVLALGFLGEKKPTKASCREAYFSAEGQAKLQEKVTLMHCVTEYPALFQMINLQAIETLSSAFKLPVGYSDHSQGIAISIASVALGACMIEKHFTLDTHLSGPDHAASLDPLQLRQMVQSIREVEMAMGNGIKIPASIELKNKKVARRSLVAKNSIKAGELFSDDNLAMLRPEGGIPPIYYWELMGAASTKNYEIGELITESIRVD